LRSPGLESGA